MNWGSGELGKWGSGEVGCGVWGVGCGVWGVGSFLSELITDTKSVEYRLYIRTGKRQEARGKRGNK